MEIYLNERPSALPAVPAPMSATRVSLAVETQPGAQLHQAWVQAELVQAAASAGNGISGFLAGVVPTGFKRTDVSGVPPRGKPV